MGLQPADHGEQFFPICCVRQRFQGAPLQPGQEFGLAFCGRPQNLGKKGRLTAFADQCQCCIQRIDPGFGGKLILPEQAMLEFAMDDPER